MFPIHITFPARSTLAGVAFRVRRFLANSRVLTRIGGTRSNHYLAVHTWRAGGEKPGQYAAKSLVLLGRTNKRLQLPWLSYIALDSISIFEKSQKKKKKKRRSECSSWAQWVQADSSHGNSEFNAPSILSAFI